MLEEVYILFDYISFVMYKHHVKVLAVFVMDYCESFCHRFLDILHEAPLFGHRKPTSILGSIFYCILLASGSYYLLRSQLS